MVYAFLLFKTNENKSILSCNVPLYGILFNNHYFFDDNLKPGAGYSSSSSSSYAFLGSWSQPNYPSGRTIYFASNGFFSDTSGNKQSTGKWVYNAQKEILTMNYNGDGWHSNTPTIYSIIEVNEYALVLMFCDGSGDILRLKRK